ncbi:hypothetical protein KSX_90770 [Ktedonospora formicarum]|uniref:Uncharacterized protein n=1 Tax=Ktedonospora formicarum TaxID=2778364 RepID=A0A8J3IFE1_9CHLR|nr:hypothetical protein KSX_90770 [Ktedonospora formicarum]
MRGMRLMDISAETTTLWETRSICYVPMFATRILHSMGNDPDTALRAKGERW